MNIYRQGDVLLIEVSALPSGEAQEIARADGRVVLAFGEVTGHAHVIVEDDARMVQFADGHRYLLVSALVQVRHEEHEFVALPPATYRVVIQREYTPAGIVRVTD